MLDASINEREHSLLIPWKILFDKDCKLPLEMSMKKISNLWTFLYYSPETRQTSFASNCLSAACPTESWTA